MVVIFGKTLVFLLVLYALAIEGSNRKFRFDYSWSPQADGWLKLHEVPVPWSEARLRCHAEGAVLASPLDSQLRDAIISYALQNSKPLDMIFTGVHATFSPGDYTSIEGETLSEAGYDQWEPKTPDNLKRAPHFSDELCGSFLRSGKLNDVACDLTLPFICEKKPESLEDIEDEEGISNVNV